MFDLREHRGSLEPCGLGNAPSPGQQMSRFGGGVSAGSLDAGPEGGGKRGQEFGVRRGRTSLATYYSVCNLLLGLPPLPPAPQCFLNYIFFFSSAKKSCSLEVLHSACNFLRV